MSSDRTQNKWWARQDSNLGPTDYESAALTAELRARREVTTSFYMSYGNWVRDSFAPKQCSVIKVSWFSVQM
jgi:hypothetical protein